MAGIDFGKDGRAAIRRTIKTLGDVIASSEIKGTCFESAEFTEGGYMVLEYMLAIEAQSRAGLSPEIAKSRNLKIREVAKAGGVFEFPKDGWVNLLNDWLARRSQPLASEAEIEKHYGPYTWPETTALWILEDRESA